MEKKKTRIIEQVQRHVEHARTSSPSSTSSISVSSVPQPGDPDFVGPPAPVTPQPGDPDFVGPIQIIPTPTPTPTPVRQLTPQQRDILISNVKYYDFYATARREFTETKQVPLWYREQVKIPEEIGKAGAGPVWLEIGYRKSLLLSTSDIEKQLDTILKRSRWFMTTQPIFDGKTWSEVKAEEPALYLKPNIYGELTPEYDIKQWRSDLHKQMNKTFGGSIAEGAKVISSSFLNIFDPNYWLAEDRSKYIYEKEYRHMKQISKGDVIGPWVGSQIPAYTNVILPIAGGAAIGAGVGAFKATSIGAKTILTIGKHSLTAGRAVEGSIGGYFGYKTIEAGIKDPLRTAISVGMALPGTIAGYKAGHTFGYGRTEAYLYGKHAFTSGSSGFIRFKSALKISRSLEYVKTHKASALDISKDIMRMTPKAAERTIGFLKSHPKTVIGGSAASYPQVVGARLARDIDIFVPTKKIVTTKQFFKGFSKTPKGEHRIDIHGFDFGGKPGVYHRFGFKTQTPIKGYVLGGKKFKVSPIPSELQGKIWGRTSTPFSRRIELDIRLLPSARKYIPSWKQRVMPFGKTVLKHEMIHQKYPWMPERLVLGLERKGFLPGLHQAASKYYSTGTARLPIKAKFVGASELLFRKGIAGTIKEAKYRWFKDVPDFITHTKSLILSAKRSYNPLNWLRAKSAQKHLDIFLDPSKTKSFGKPDTIIGKFVKSKIKPGITPKEIIVSGGDIGYIYPSYVYPKGYMGYGVGGYMVKPSYGASKIVSSYPSSIGISYKLPTVSSYVPYGYPSYVSSKPFVTSSSKPLYIPPVILPYKQSTYIPPSVPTTIPSTVILKSYDYKPYEYKPYDYLPTIEHPPYVPLPGGGVIKKRRRKIDPLDIGYRFREWKTLTMKEFIGGKW